MDNRFPPNIVSPSEANVSLKTPSDATRACQGMPFSDDLASKDANRENFDGAPVAMWLLDIRGETLRANRAAHVITRCNNLFLEEETRLLRLLSTSECAKLREHLRHCEVTGLNFELDVETLSKKNLHLSACVSMDRTGKADGFRIAAFDVSASKARESHLQAINHAGRKLATSLDFRETIPHLLRTMHDSFPGLFYVDLRIDGEDVERIYPATDDTLELASYITTLERHFPLQGGAATTEPSTHRAPSTSMLIHCDGASGRASIITVPLMLRGNLSGTLTRVSGVGDCGAEDVVTLEALGELVSMALQSGRRYEQLRVVIKSKQTLLANVAHEIKNVLTSIKLRSEILSLADDTSVSAQGQVIDRLVVRMSRMLNDLMDQVSVERQQLRMRPAMHAVQGILKDVDDNYRIAAAERSLSIGLSDADGLQVYCDAERCLQVLNNLVSNAIKFASPGTRIDITAKRHKQWISLCVTNHGAGLTPEQLKKVFIEHWQTRDGRKARGHGLGLAIAKGIVTAWGGKLWAESTPGKTTAFCFTVPAGAASFS